MSNSPIKRVDGVLSIPLVLVVDKAEACKEGEQEQAEKAGVSTEAASKGAGTLTEAAAAAAAKG